MLELLAISREDGWGIVRDGQKLMLIRPPYDKINLQTVNEESVEKAVLAFGFVMLEQEFQDWKSLVLFLNEQVRAARVAMGQDLDIERLRDEFMLVAPEDIIRTFLKEIENELLPNRQFDHAESLLTALLMATSVGQNPSLLGQIAILLQKVLDERDLLKKEKLRDIISDANNMQEKFSHAAGRYGEEKIVAASRCIAERGQVLVV